MGGVDALDSLADKGALLYVDFCFCFCSVVWLEMRYATFRRAGKIHTGQSIHTERKQTRNNEKQTVPCLHFSLDPRHQRQEDASQANG